MYRNGLARAEAPRAASRQVHTAYTAALEQAIEQLQPRLRLAVIFGGNKQHSGSVVYQTNNTRSWKSYEAVAQDIADALRRIGFRHIDLFPEDMQLSERLSRAGTHMAWLNSGGVQGCNSAAHGAATLEMLGIPYVGHDPLAATTLDNKHAFKREAVCAGLPTAPFTTWHSVRGPFLPEINSRFLREFGDYPGPFIVKPVSGRASLHVHVVPDRDSLTEAVAEVYRKTDHLVLVEKYLSGREFCVAVAGPTIASNGTISSLDEPFAFGALERLFAADEMIFTSMDVKPITTARFTHLDRDAEPKLLSEIHRLARDVFLEFNLRSLIRIDMRADENGDLYILEANPKPDLKRPVDGVTSLISAGLAQTGLGYDDLILSLLADRLAYLFTRCRGTVSHILELLDSDLLDSPQQSSTNELDAMILALRVTAQRMM